MPDCLLLGLVASLSGLFFSHVEDHVLIVYPNSSDPRDISHIPAKTSRNSKLQKKAKDGIRRNEMVSRASGRGDNKRQEGEINIGVDT